MSKPSMPNIPGFGAMTETMDFVKNMWGGMSTPGMGIPGMVMPTLSVEDIDKQIKDLKAVESWLNVNMSMLRGTIQALEVQSATISTLKSMGESLTAGVRQATAGTSASTPAGSANAPAASAFPFSFPATAAAAAAASKSGSAPAAAAEPSTQSAQAADDGNASTGQKAESPFPTPLPNPAIWWNMLQDQFKQAVSTAMISDPAAKSEKTEKTESQSGADNSAATPRKRKTPPK